MFHLFLFQATEREIIWMMRVGIVLVGILATVIAITVNSVYGLWYLCGDLVYVMLFPQLLCVIYFPWANTYGSAVGFVLGLLFRLLGGEPLLSLPAALKYPYYYCDEAGTCSQCFPFKTLAMLITLVCILTVSSLTHWLFTKNIISSTFDIFKVFNIYEVNSVNCLDNGVLMETKKTMEYSGMYNDSFVADSSDNH